MSNNFEMEISPNGYPIGTTDTNTTEQVIKQPEQPKKQFDNGFLQNIEVGHVILFIALAYFIKKTLVDPVYDDEEDCEEFDPCNKSGWGDTKDPRCNKFGYIDDDDC